MGSSCCHPYYATCKYGRHVTCRFLSTDKETHQMLTGLCVCKTHCQVASSPLKEPKQELPNLNTYYNMMMYICIYIFNMAEINSGKNTDTYMNSCYINTFSQCSIPYQLQTCLPAEDFTHLYPRKRNLYFSQTKHRWNQRVNGRIQQKSQSYTTEDYGRS